MTSGSRDKYRRGYRRRRRSHLQEFPPLRTNRALEFWFVVIVAVMLLSSGVSWVWSAAYPGAQTASVPVVITAPTAPQPFAAQKPPANAAPPVIILHENSFDDK